MIQVMSVGGLQEQAYFFIDDNTKHGFIIDPGAEPERLLAYIKEQGFIIEKILITHGHYDHIGAAEALREALKAPIVIHQEGKKYVEDANWNLSLQFGRHCEFEADEYVVHGDQIELSTNPEMALKVIYVPGHTADGVAYYNEAQGVAFVGDIIFAGAVGRSDFPGGNGTQLLEGIRREIFTLPKETVLCPGHGESSTVAQEEATNPYFNMYE